MEPKSDHTTEVEKRITAIPIQARDYCSFFAVREAALLPLRECFFCTYGQFHEGQTPANPQGFCKFKK